MPLYLKQPQRAPGGHTCRAPAGSGCRSNPARSSSPRKLSAYALGWKQGRQMPERHWQQRVPAGCQDLNCASKNGMVAQSRVAVTALCQPHRTLRLQLSSDTCLLGALQACAEVGYGSWQGRIGAEGQGRLRQSGGQGRHIGTQARVASQRLQTAGSAWQVGWTFGKAAGSWWAVGGGQGWWARGGGRLGGRPPQRRCSRQAGTSLDNGSWLALLPAQLRTVTRARMSGVHAAWHDTAVQHGHEACTERQPNGQPGQGPHLMHAAHPPRGRQTGWVQAAAPSGPCARGAL